MNTLSEIRLTGYPSGNAAIEAEITIRMGKVEERISKPAAQAVCFQADEDKILITLPNIARIRVTKERIVTIQPHKDVHDLRTLEIFILNHVISILLHLLHRLVLHAGVLRIEDRVIAIAGESGSGKSTICASLCQHRNYSIVSEEHAVLDFHEAEIRAQLGSARLQLWEDALSYLGMDTRDLYALRPQLKKFYYPVSRAKDESGLGLPLNLCVILKRSRAPGIHLRQLFGQKKLSAIVGQVYAWHYVEGMGLQHEVIQKCLRLANRIPVWECRHPASESGLSSVVDALTCDDIQQNCGLNKIAETTL